MRSTDVHAEPLEPQRVKLQRAICSRVAPQHIWQGGALAARDGRHPKGRWRPAARAAERRRVDVKVRGEDGIFLQRRRKPSCPCLCLCLSAAARSAVPLSRSCGNNDSLSRQRPLAELALHSFMSDDPKLRHNTGALLLASVVSIAVATFNALVAHCMTQNLAAGVTIKIRRCAKSKTCNFLSVTPANTNLKRGRNIFFFSESKVHLLKLVGAT